MKSTRIESVLEVLSWPRRKKRMEEAAHSVSNITTTKHRASFVPHVPLQPLRATSTSKPHCTRPIHRDEITPYHHHWGQNPSWSHPAPPNPFCHRLFQHLKYTTLTQHNRKTDCRYQNPNSHKVQVSTQRMGSPALSPRREALFKAKPKQTAAKSGARRGTNRRM